MLWDGLAARGLRAGPAADFPGATEKKIEAVGSQQLSRSMGLLVALLLSLCLLQLLPPLGAAAGDRGAVVGTAGTLLWVLVHLEAGGCLITQMTRYVSQVLIWRLCFDFA